MCIQATYDDAYWECSDLDYTLINFSSEDDWDDLVVEAGNRTGHDFCFNVIVFLTTIFRSKKYKTLCWHGQDGWNLY